MGLCRLFLFCIMISLQPQVVGELIRNTMCGECKLVELWSALQWSFPLRNTSWSFLTASWSLGNYNDHSLLASHLTIWLTGLFTSADFRLLNEFCDDFSVFRQLTFIEYFVRLFVHCNINCRLVNGVFGQDSGTDDKHVHDMSRWQWGFQDTLQFLKA